ncbi:MAG: hypothetical protein Q8O92_00685 [Candidatus Latescibacter sp.]|nr:hypothetical protein [Candidatus Latescibacter sp.]
MLNQDFKEFIQLLNENRVEYLVVGGYAVGFHGHPRYTKDLDIWIKISQDNARKVLFVIGQFGFGSLGLTNEDFLIPGQIIQMGYLPVRIDIISTVDGVDFDECYKNKEEIEIDGTKVYFIDLENLKKNKKTTGRLQDLADLENLQ